MVLSIPTQKFQNPEFKWIYLKIKNKDDYAC